MKFRPCIDLHNGKVKQIVGSSFNEYEVKENYVSQYGADYYAKMYKNSGLKGGHIIAIGKGNDNEVIKALHTYPDGLQVGGGINRENGTWYLNNGASHVIVTSYIFTNSKFNLEYLKSISNTVGKDRLVIDISCRKKNGRYFVVIDKWQKFTDFEFNQDSINILSNFCSEFLIHAVDVEGMCNGTDIELLENISKWVEIPCTYAGGITSMNDINILKEIGSGKIDFTVGSALDIFGGNLKYEELLSFS